MPALPNTMAAQQGQQPQQPAQPPPPPAPWVNPYDAGINDLIKRMSMPPPPPMYTPEQQEQRVRQNQGDESLGMLAMLSGDEALGGAGGQVFKQALAMQTPKIGERGTTDQLRGKFTYSPEYLRERDEQTLDKMRNLQAQAAASHGESEANRLSREETARYNREMQERLGNQRISVSVGNRERTGDSRDAKLEDSMADDFDRNNKTHVMVLNAHKNLQAIAQKTDAASDIAFIYSYMKMLDPTSVVREGEFATAQNAAGVPDRIRNAYNASINGTRLNPQQRTDMLGTAGRLSETAFNAMSESAQQYAAKARRRGLDPVNVVGDEALLKPRAKPDASVDVGKALGAQPAKRALPQTVQPAGSAGGMNRMVEGPL